jgi:hypothetical protein
MIMNEKRRRPLADVPSKIYMPDYFYSATWMDFYRGIQSERPLIFICVTSNAKIIEMVVRKGGIPSEIKNQQSKLDPKPEPELKPQDPPSESPPSQPPLQFQPLKKNQNKYLTQEILNDIIKSVPVESPPASATEVPVNVFIDETALKNEIPPMNGSEELPQELPEEKPPEPPIEIIKEPEPESKEGEVALGKWVEFNSGDHIKTGRVEWISADETEFLIKPKGESGVVVGVENLLSLLSDIGQA